MSNSKPISTRGIVCWLEFSQGGQIRLVMDDATCEDFGERRLWKKKVLFTHNDYNEQEFLRSELAESDFADIGLNVVSRLAAFVQTGKTRRDK